MSDTKTGCLPTPCTTCPYRVDVPSGIWAKEEYEKLVAYDRPTFEQPPNLFMCHQSNNSLCTGWVQSHANREHAFDLLALRMIDRRKVDVDQVSKVAQSEPMVKLFLTGSGARRHGLKQLAKPGPKAKSAMKRITKKRQQQPSR